MTCGPRLTTSGLQCRCSKHLADFFTNVRTAAFGPDCVKTLAKTKRRKIELSATWIGCRKTHGATRTNICHRDCMGSLTFFRLAQMANREALEMTPTLVRGNCNADSQRSVG